MATHFEYFTALEIGTTFNQPPSLETYASTLKDSNNSLFVAWDTASEPQIPLGCGALRTFTSQIPGHDGGLVGNAGEVRSMHTIAQARRRGVGKLILRHIEQTAKEVGLNRLYIETGVSNAVSLTWTTSFRGKSNLCGVLLLTMEFKWLEGYAAARRMYSDAGFEQCASFAEYTDHADVLFMVKEI